MLIELNRETIPSLKNPRFRSYALIYARIFDDFQTQVQKLGLEIDDVDYGAEARARIEALRAAGVTVRNDEKSIYLNRFSPACEACRLGADTETFFISLQCHRNCFFCFNPNQENYEYFAGHKRNLVQELDQARARGATFQHLALTGGEPLLFKPETIAFFERAHTLYPDAYTRLYTSGDHADEATLEALAAAHLDEIRFSFRVIDSPAGQRHTLDRIALAKRHIPQVMVEMPVLPGTQEEMQALLRDLDRLDIASINLLEFCFPMTNAPAYRERGYKIRKHPFRVLYDYWYAGGLPVSHSEVDCLDLVQYAREAGLKIGVHYCSLENKYTGQIYRQNSQAPLPKTGSLSPRDFFIKSAKVFGNDIPKVLRKFRASGFGDYRRDRDHDFLEFHVSQIPELRDMDLEVGLSWSVFEERNGAPVQRELRIDLIHPETFDPLAEA